MKNYKENSKRLALSLVSGLGALALLTGAAATAEAAEGTSDASKAGTNIVAQCSADVKLEMVRCPAGTFTMGSPAEEQGREDDDEAQHQVTISKPFWIGKYEVTQAQYKAVMGNNPSHFKGDNLPVEKVTWDKAVSFCKKLTASEKKAGRLPEGYKYSLPTEAQWEYACRAGTKTALNSGKNLTDTEECSNVDEVGWYVINAENKTHPVGQKKANEWGLYDMHGNVMEWCLDWYDDYPTEAVTDPAGPEKGMTREARGGAWIFRASYCRSAYRGGNDPDDDSYAVGFRVALVPEK